MATVKVIRGGKVITGDGAVIDGGVVVVVGERITAVGEARQVIVPPDAECIEAAGMTIMPGIMDAHWHLGGDFRTANILREALARGITTIASVTAGPGAYPLRDAIKAGHLRGCARYLVGCAVVQTKGHVNGRFADGPWEVRKAVREMAECDFIKTTATGGFSGALAGTEKCSWENYTYPELKALADQAHVLGKRVAVHAHNQPGLNRSIKAGIDAIHHGAFIDDEALEGIARKNLFYIPTLTVTCQKNIEAHKETDPWAVEPMLAAAPIHRAGVRKAHEMGIKIGLGTDSPGKRVWQIGDKTLWELVELVACGLSPMDAIVAGTRNTADSLGILDEVGTLAAGKRADLLIVNGDPAADVAVLYERENVALVMKDGVVESTNEAFKTYYKVRGEQ